ncbi:MAG: hypothetical protein U5N85_06570 [Arcicella sp.]|nr:hypothetical protein [Arcicella sp.]
MLHLPSKNLSATTQTYLDNLQKQVDAEPTFKQKANKAKSLWGNKRKPKSRRKGI